MSESSLSSPPDLPGLTSEPHLSILMKCGRGGRNFRGRRPGLVNDDWSHRFATICAQPDRSQFALGNTKKGYGSRCRRRTERIQVVCRHTEVAAVHRGTARFDDVRDQNDERHCCACCGYRGYADGLECAGLRRSLCCKRNANNTSWNRNHTIDRTRSPPINRFGLSTTESDSSRLLDRLSTNKPE